MAKHTEQTLDQDLEMLKQLASLKNTPAGKELIRRTKDACSGAIVAIVQEYNKGGNNFIPSIATLEANMNIINILSTAQYSYEELVNEMDDTD